MVFSNTTSVRHRIRNIVSHGIAMAMGAGVSILALGSEYRHVSGSTSPNKDEDILSFLAPTMTSMTTIFPQNPNQKRAPEMCILYNSQTRNPMWVMELLEKDNLIPDGKKKKRPMNQKFVTAEEVLISLQSRNGFFRKSGYDRGHMIPAANFDGDDKDATFNLCNISPQTPTCNRKVWLGLETLIRKLAIQELENEESKQNHTQVVVISGPLWLPSNKVLPQIEKGTNNKNQRELFQFSFPALGTPPTLVSVPTHFFKIIWVFQKEIRSFEDEKYIPVKCAAFVVPNEYRKTNKSSKKPINLQNYLVRISDLEAVSGLRLCSWWVDPLTKDDSLLKDLVDLKTQKVWIESQRPHADLEDGVVCFPPSTISKRTEARIRKQLNEITKLTDNNSDDAHELHAFKHICENGNCNQIIEL